MNYNHIYESYKEQFEYLKTLTKKELFIQDIYENSVCNSFLEVGFGVKYKNSFRKFKRGLFLPYDDNRKKINDYFSSLSIEERRKLFRKLYYDLHKYSLT